MTLQIISQFKRMRIRSTFWRAWTLIVFSSSRGFDAAAASVCVHTMPVDTWIDRLDLSTVEDPPIKLQLSRVYLLAERGRTPNGRLFKTLFLSLYLYQWFVVEFMLACCSQPKSFSSSFVHPISNPFIARSLLTFVINNLDRWIMQTTAYTHTYTIFF